MVVRMIRELVLMSITMMGRRKIEIKMEFAMEKEKKQMK